MQAQQSLVLSGLRVIEMSAFIAAPLAGATLASLGADVIRIDPPGGGIDIDRWPLHEGRSLYWEGLNQGKRSVTIDTRTSDGQATAGGLITAAGPGAGILLTNLPIANWSSYRELRSRRPDLIMVAISGDGNGRSEVDYTVNAALGFPFITGPTDAAGPINHVLPAWDVMTAFLAVSAILAAERHRRLTGEGQLVEVSLLDVGLAVAGHLGLIGEAALNPEPRERSGNYVYGTFGRDFTTRDRRHVMVLALTARQWHSLSAAAGLTSRLAKLQREKGLDFELEADRWEAREEIGELLAEWIRERDLAAIREAFESHRVLWGPYQTFKQLLSEDGRASERNPLFAHVDHPGLGRYITARSPMRFSALATSPPRAAPELGQHTTEVLRELGLEGRS